MTYNVNDSRAALNFVSQEACLRRGILLKYESMTRSPMRKSDLDAMAFDDLWLLHEEITKILSEKITAEKLELEKRLAQLNPPEAVLEGAGSELGADRPRRRYPKVPPKYCNPMEPSETWSGRGKQPRWLVAALQSGHKLEDFRIEDSERKSDDAVQRT